MGREFELKFAATTHQLNEIRTTLDLDYETIRMNTTYYDTPAGDLARRKCTLRCRQENENWVCTIKTPGLSNYRGEWECICPDINQALPMLVAQGAPDHLIQIAQAGLVPVCGARFTRLAAKLQISSTELELALDEGVLTGGGREIPLSEVEVELKAGSELTAVAFASELKAKFCLHSEPQSKYRRARALAEGE